MRIRLLAVVSLVVLGALFALWRMTREITSVQAADERPAKQVTTPVNDPAPIASGTPVAPRSRSPELGPAIAAKRTPIYSPATSAEPAEPTDAGPPDAPDVSPLRRQLITDGRRGMDAIDGFVSDCVRVAVKAGRKPTGIASLTLKIEQVKGKRVVTQVAIEPIDTTLKDQPLLECLRDTGRKFEIEIPEGMSAVTATHLVDLDNGAVNDHRLTTIDLYQGDKMVPPE